MESGLATHNNCHRGETLRQSEQQFTWLKRTSEFCFHLDLTDSKEAIQLWSVLWSCALRKKTDEVTGNKTLLALATVIHLSKS